MKSKPKSNVERVRQLCAELNSLANTRPGQADWLRAVEAKASKQTPGWRSEVGGFLQGLAAAGCITPQQQSDLFDKLHKCLEKDVELSDFVLPILWTMIVAGWVLCTRLVGVPQWLVAIGTTMTAGVGIFWAYKRRWFVETCGKRHSLSLMVASTILVAAFAVGVPWILGDGVWKIGQWFSLRSFASENAAFAKNPHGFPMIRDFAKKNFGVDVLMANADESWSSTKIALNSFSPASMDTGPGFCWLNISPESIKADFGVSKDVHEVPWTQGVMVHELAHCLDIRRDYEALALHGTHVLAIAPADRVGISDVATYHVIKNRPSTKLWREAVADIAAVGFWRLRYPEQAGQLIDGLRGKRAEHAKDDQAHATMCWIDRAMNVPAPESEKDLFQWADQLRQRADCSLSGA